MAKFISLNADGLAMPDIEHWASNLKAMAGSDQTDVIKSFILGFFGGLLNKVDTLV